MVVAPQPEAVEAGVGLLEAGGNAVDAAVACAMTQAVVDPLQCGIAGFGSMGIYTAHDRTLRYLDFHAPAPRNARPDMWADRVLGEARDGWGFIVDGHVNELGYQSLCVPATLRALGEAHAAHGRMPWPAVLEPAITDAEQGWLVRPGVHRYWSLPGYMGHAGNPDRLAFTSAGLALYCQPDGDPRMVGDRIRNPDHAAVLRAIADNGADEFYQGGIADAIVADVQANGGLLTREDLAAYRPHWRAPLWGSYRGYRVGTNQPPGGGAMLLEMLNILERFDLESLGHNTAAYVRTVSEVMRQATVDKDRHLGDPAFVDVPLERLLSAAHASQAAASIEAGQRVRVPRLNHEGPGTTHVSVVDRDGNCVTLTHSLGMPSGVITGGLGFMYNGCMSVFDPRPGHTHSIAPGKARFSSIMPSVVFRDDRPYLVVGAPGGTQIAMGVLQVILNLVDFGQALAEATMRPRFSATSDVIDVVNRVPRAVTAALENAGYETLRLPVSYGIAMVHGIMLHEDGSVEGAADPAADGMALAAAPA